MLAFLIPTCVIGVFAFLVYLCEKLEKEKTKKETEEEVTTCLMETIEAPQIEPKGYYNEYGLWIGLKKKNKKGE